MLIVGLWRNGTLLAFARAERLGGGAHAAGERSIWTLPVQRRLLVAVAFIAAGFVTANIDARIGGPVAAAGFVLFGLVGLDLARNRARGAGDSSQGNCPLGNYPIT